MFLWTADEAMFTLRSRPRGGDHYAVLINHNARYAGRVLEMREELRELGCAVVAASDWIHLSRVEKRPETVKLYKRDIHLSW